VPVSKGQQRRLGLPQWYNCSADLSAAASASISTVMNVQQCLSTGQAPAGRVADSWRPPMRSLCRAGARAPSAQLDCCSSRQTQRLRGAAAAGAEICLDQAIGRLPARHTRSACIVHATADPSAAASTAAAPTAASAAASALAGSAARRLSPPDRSGGGRSPAKLAVFVSGGGSNLMALHAATQDGRINGSIVVRTILLWSTPWIVAKPR
jgi:hypothetical protein